MGHRSWNPTQLQGSTYGFFPTVEETPPPRVNIIAPDKVTGNDKVTSIPRPQLCASTAETRSLPLSHTLSSSLSLSENLVSRRHGW